VARDKLTGSQPVKIFPAFHATQITLPLSQQPSTCPYSEPEQTSPCPLSRFPKIHFKIILPSTPGTSKWFLSFGFLHQNLVYTSPLPRTSYMPRSSHSSKLG